MIGSLAFCSLRMRFSASTSGVSMPTKTLTKVAACISSRISVCLAMLSVASQAKLQRKAAILLPLREMRQQIARRLAIADEIVVDEIDGLRHRRLRQHGVELGK